jgi:HNH endonuclease
MELILLGLFLVFTFFAVVIILSFIAVVMNLACNIILAPFRFVNGLSKSPATNRDSYIYIPPSKQDREDKYAKNWSTIARKYKESRNWTCQKCLIYLGSKEHKRLLHVHHINRNSMDNSHSNLIALCLQCHSAQPGKGHKRLRSAIIKDGRWNEIDQIRKN